MHLSLVRVASTADFSASRIRRFEVEGKPIIVLRAGDSYFALDAICTHAYADLSRGILMSDKIICPLHLSRFDIRTGKVESPPATVPLKTYAVKIEDGSILLEV